MRLALLAVAALALPTVAVAQLRQIPNEHAAERAEAMVALHRATHRRGSVVPVEPDRGPNGTSAASRAGRASPVGGGPDGLGQPDSPGHPVTPALPPTPVRKGGQSATHRP
jgi:hypothetical protein